MVDLPEDDKPRELKLYFKPSEIAAIDEFRKTYTRNKSRNVLFHVAIEYYMAKMRRSKGVTGLHDFPVDVAAEGVLPYTRGHPQQKKKGNDHS